MQTFANWSLFIFLIIFLNGCKEECSSCLNGGTCRGDSCECSPGFTGANCEKSVTVGINKIVLTSLPFNNPATSSHWDNDNGPDVYFELKDGSGTVLYTHEAATVSNLSTADLPVEFNIVTPFVISNLNLSLLVVFYDKDNGEDFDFTDDFIGSVEFQIHDYIAGSDAYPTEVEKTEQNLAVQLGLQWGSE